jgi:purine-binding chemotaxis protein CheW
MPELLENQYLTLSLAGERYAIPVERVLEVLECTRITRLPCQARYLKGLIDLRGRGIPVLDLRLRFGMAEAATTQATAIVVVELAGDEGLTVVGLLADAVHEVVEIDAGKVEAAPRFGASGADGLAGDFLKGIGRRDDEFLLILELDRIFDAADLSTSVQGAEAACEPSSSTITA